MIPARIFAALILVLFLPGSAKCAALDELYYPLKEGMRWEYRVISDKSEMKKLIVTNLPPREINERTVVPRKWEINGTTSYQLMAKDDGGIYRYAGQNSENAEPTIITPKQYEIKYPIAEGTTWNITTKLSDKNLQVNLTIESVTDNVVVPAGTFRDCVKIKGVGEDKDNAAVTAYEWYAPKVGVVKSLVTLKQKAKDGTMSTENQNYQLQSFQP